MTEKEVKRKMNFKKGLVSICIPTYNGSDYIKKTLDSVFSQSYSDIEVIITDDGSTDGTLDVIKEYSDSRIHVYKNENNRGLPGNWNEAVSHAHGEFVKVLCQDDLLFPDALKLQVQSLQNTDASCVIGNSLVINRDDETVMKRERFKKDAVISGVKFARKSMLGRNIYSEPPNLLYRTELFYKYGGYDETLKYTPDWDFALRISLEGKISCLSSNIMSFRISDGSETTNLSKNRMKELINDTDRFYDKHKSSELLGLSVFNEFEFKLITRLAALARLMIISFSKSDRSRR